MCLLGGLEAMQQRAKGALCVQLCIQQMGSGAGSQSLRPWTRAKGQKKKSQALKKGKAWTKGVVLEGQRVWMKLGSPTDNISGVTPARPGHGYGGGWRAQVIPQR